MSKCVRLFVCVFVFMRVFLFVLKRPAPTIPERRRRVQNDARHGVLEEALQVEKAQKFRKFVHVLRQLDDLGRDGCVGELSQMGVYLL